MQLIYGYHQKKILFSFHSNFIWPGYSGSVDDNSVLIHARACTKSSSKPMTSSGPFYQHGLTLILAWICNHIDYKVCDEIMYPFLNFSGATLLGLWLLIYAEIKLKPC